MTEAPKKIWVDYSPHTEGWGDVSVAEEHGYTEYLRRDKHLAYLADYRAAYEGSCEQIDKQRAEIERLREALEHSKTGWENVIELELLDPAHDFTASGLLYEARAALAHKETDP